MQDPSPEEGEYFKRGWFRYYTDLPKTLNYYISSDAAVTDEQIARRDYTEIGVWGVDSADRIFCVDWWYGRKTTDVTIDELLNKVDLYNPLDFIGEGGTIRRAIEPWLEKRMRERGVFVSPLWLTSNKEKTALAQTFRGLCNMGRIYFPKTDWAERVIEQLIKFPGGRHDDAVDTCSLFGRHIANVWAARDPEESKEVQWDAPLQIKDFMRKAS
jgi:predicted phage terminase large subunit-like protein